MNKMLDVNSKSDLRWARSLILLLDPALDMVGGDLSRSRYVALLTSPTGQTERSNVRDFERSFLRLAAAKNTEGQSIGRACLKTPAFNPSSYRENDSMKRVPVPAQESRKAHSSSLKNQGFSVTTLRTNEIRATVQYSICKGATSRSNSETDASQTY